MPRIKPVLDECQTFEKRAQRGLGGKIFRFEKEAENRIVSGQSVDDAGGSWHTKEVGGGRKRWDTNQD